MLLKSTPALFLIIILIGQIFTFSIPANGQSYFTVQLQSRSNDGVSNIGTISVSPYGSFNLPYPFFTSAGSFTIQGSNPTYNGERYIFDHWETSGSISVANPYSIQTTMTASGGGTLTEVFTVQKRSFTMSINPSLVSVRPGDAALYTATLTATSIPSGDQFEIALESSGLPLDTSFTYQSGIWLRSSQQTTTSAISIYTKSTTPPGAYPITIKGTIIGTSTTFSQQIQLQVLEQGCPPYCAELQVSSISWNPPNPSIDNSIFFTYTETNHGNSEAPPHKVNLYIDGIPFDEDSAPALSSGLSQTRTFPKSWIVTAGSHEIMVKTDVNRQVSESNSDNNILRVQMGQKSQISTTLTLSLSPNVAKPQSSPYITITGTLIKNDNGAGYGDKPIKLEWPGGMTTVVTKSDGTFSYGTNVRTFDPTTYTFTASFAGEETPTSIFLSTGSSATLAISSDGSTSEGTPITPSQPSTPTQSFDFGLSINPISVSIVAGDTAMASININQLSGTSKPVSLNCSGIPSSQGKCRINGSTQSVIVTPTASAILTIETGSTTSPKAYSATITASGSGITKTATFSINVNSMKTSDKVPGSEKEITTPTIPKRTADNLPPGFSIVFNSSPPKETHNFVFSTQGPQTKNVPNPSGPVSGIFATVTTTVTGAILIFDSGGITYSKTISPNSNTLINFQNPLSISNIRISIDGRAYADDQANIGYVIASSGSTQSGTQSGTTSTTPTGVGSESSTSLGKFSVVKREYQLSRYESTEVKFTGNINDYKRGQAIDLTIKKPDGNTENLKIMATKDGAIVSSYLLDKSSIVGTYTVEARYLGSLLGTISFNVKEPTSSKDTQKETMIQTKKESDFIVHGDLGVKYPTALIWGKKGILVLKATNNLPEDVLVVFTVTDANKIIVDKIDEINRSIGLTGVEKAPAIIKSKKTEIVEAMTHQLQPGTYYVSWDVFKVSDKLRSNPIAKGGPVLWSIETSFGYPAINISIDKTTSNPKRTEYEVNHYKNNAYSYMVEPNQKNKLKISYYEEDFLGPTGYTRYLFIFVPSTVGILGTSSSANTVISEVPIQINVNGISGKWFRVTISGSELEKRPLDSIYAWKAESTLDITTPSSGIAPIYVGSTKFIDKVSNSILENIAQEIITQLVLSPSATAVLTPATFASIGIAVTQAFIDYDVSSGWLILDTGKQLDKTKSQSNETPQQKTTKNKESQTTNPSTSQSDGPRPKGVSNLQITAKPDSVEPDKKSEIIVSGFYNPGIGGGPSYPTLKVTGTLYEKDSGYDDDKIPSPCYSPTYTIEAHPPIGWPQDTRFECKFSVTPSNFVKEWFEGKETEWFAKILVKIDGKLEKTLDTNVVTIKCPNCK